MSCHPRKNSASDAAAQACPRTYSELSLKPDFMNGLADESSCRNRLARCPNSRIAFPLTYSFSCKLRREHRFTAYAGLFSSSATPYDHFLELLHVSPRQGCADRRAIPLSRLLISVIAHRQVDHPSASISRNRLHRGLLDALMQALACIQQNAFAFTFQTSTDRQATPGRRAPARGGGAHFRAGWFERRDHSRDCPRGGGE